MDSLVVILLIFGLVSSLVKRFQKTAKQQTSSGSSQMTAPTQPERPPSESVSNELERYGKNPAAPFRKTKPNEREQQFSPSLAEGVSNSAGKRYAGSLGFSSLESMSDFNPAPKEARGSIWDEPVLLQDRTAPAKGLSFLQGQNDALVQGIVMSEILTRPAQRKWGRRLG